MTDDAITFPSRRNLLFGTAATATSFSLTGFASPAFAECSTTTVQKLGRPPYPVPSVDFANANILETIAGIRPHRIGGVRLERAAPLGSGPDRRFLIHNYGHSGAGITLSFGCASVAADHVGDIIRELGIPRSRISVAVVGSGVIGLTTADELKRRWKDLPVTVYAKDLEISKTCSWVAAGQFEPSGAWRQYTPRARTELYTYLRRSRDRIVKLLADGTAADYGITARRNYSLRWGSDGFDQGTPHDVVSCPKRGPLPFRRLNEEGLEYQTWLINPRILLPQLVRDLNKRGVYRRRAKIEQYSDFFGLLQERIVINCTGVGAGAITRDPFIRPVRGQIAILENPNPSRLNYFFSGGCGNDVTYLFCRQNDIVVGGTWEPGETNPVTDSATIRTLLARARMIFNGETMRCLPPTSRPG
jgi:D-amino-acid oxidase